MSYYLNKNQQFELGINKIGKNCKISKKIRGYSLKCVVGNNVRIDDDVVLKGKITIKSNVHIARGCTLSGGKKGIILENFSTLSNFCQIFTESDDYIKTTVSGGTLDDKERKKFCKTYSKEVSIGKSTIIGPFSVILPGAEIGDFCTVGPYSCIYKKINSGYYLYGSNIKKNLMKKRNLSKLKKNYEKYFKNY
jgi:acetyltransferase-like isoleucine patch superfamily enzyme